jgi:hypothetical protein
VRPVARWFWLPYRRERSQHRCAFHRSHRVNCLRPPALLSCRELQVSRSDWQPLMGCSFPLTRALHTIDVCSVLICPKAGRGERKSVRGTLKTLPLFNLVALNACQAGRADGRRGRDPLCWGPLLTCRGPWADTAADRHRSVDVSGRARF